MRTAGCTGSKTVRFTPWLLWLSLAELGTMLTFGTYSGTLPLLRVEWQMTGAQAGGIFAMQQIGYTVAVLVLSSLTDLVGVRRIYLFSSVLNGLASLLFALLANNFRSAAFFRILCGVGLAGTYVPGMRLVVERAPPGRRGASMGMYISAFSLGAAASLFATSLLLRWGWRMAFLISGLGPLVASVIAWSVVFDVRPLRARRIPFRQALQNARALRFSLAYAAHNWELFGMRAWLPSFLTAGWVAAHVPLGQATARASAFGGLVLVASAISNATGGWLSDHLGRRPTIVLFLTASAACSLSVGWLLPYGLRVILPLATLYGLLVTAESSTLSTAVAESADPEALGTTLAIQSSLGFAASAISPALFGFLLDAFGGWGWAFSSLGLVALVGVGIVLGSASCEQARAST
ncbi:MAG: MFS transporter [Armatimonadota bacterium]|nr:MFS transporter [Armatimonadota bacterium]MDR5702872.1 MFS transporter [Armatimonadota bacterium]